MSLRVRFEDPQNGWIGLRVENNGDVFEESLSYTPYNSILDLVTAITTLFHPGSSAAVNWNSEPTEYDFLFSNDNGTIDFSIVEFPDGNRQQNRSCLIFQAQGSFTTICIPFWRALRQLQGRLTTQELSERFGRRFPDEELKKLTNAIAVLNHL